jgi:high-affinity iron transporter
VTGLLLILFAAGLIAHGVHEFNEVGWIPPLVEHIWNLDTVISETSLLGQLLKTLFGYSSSPSLTEMIAYFTYLAVVTVFWRRDTAAVKATATSQA